MLEAARESFFTRGYAGTTVEQVARAVGLSKRSLYLYFKNKDELFLTVASEGIALLQRRLETLEVGTSSVDQLIVQTTREYLDFAHEEPEYFSIIFRDTTAEMVDNVSPELRQRVVRQEQACLNIVATIIEQGIRDRVIPPVDPLETAIIFWGTVTGIILLSLGGSQTVIVRESREALIDKAVAVLFQGLKSTLTSGEEQA